MPGGMECGQRRELLSHHRLPLGVLAVVLVLQNNCSIAYFRTNGLPSLQSSLPHEMNQVRP